MCYFLFKHTFTPTTHILETTGTASLSLVFKFCFPIYFLFAFPIKHPELSSASDFPFHPFESPQSLEGLFPQNESSLIKISILVSESKEATTQKSNFHQKQKSHEVLANTMFQLTTEPVNIPYATSPNETTLSSKGLI